MATKEICDKCGKESPDSNGLHISNSWYEFVIKIRSHSNFYSDQRRKVLLCKDCFSKTGIDKCNWEYCK